MALYPMKFEPVYKDYIWGGTGLLKYGRKFPGKTAAESWDVSCHPDGMSIISSGFFKGKTLQEIIDTFAIKLLGNSVYKRYKNNFPLLLKLIDARDKLSVQVHPDNDYAARYENGQLGKNEMWYILDAASDSSIIYDVKPGVSRDVFRKAIDRGEALKCLQSVRVKPGDAVFIPAGVVHAIGGGLMIFEIQQSSNLTYRVYDYDRTDAKGNKRELHIEKSLECIDFNSKGRKAVMDCPELLLTGNFTGRELARNEYFVVEEMTGDGDMLQKADGDRFFIYTVIFGSPVLSSAGTEIGLVPGDSVFVPADMGKYTISGKFKLIKTYVG